MYTPPPGREEVKRKILDKLTHLYYSASLALHRVKHRPPRRKTAKIIVVVPAHNQRSAQKSTAPL